MLASLNITAAEDLAGNQIVNCFRYNWRHVKIAFHMTTYIRISDYRALFKPTGPLFAFIVPWTLVIIGQLLQLCDIIVPVYSSFYLIVIGNMLTLCGIAFTYQTFMPLSLSLNRQTFENIVFSRRFKLIISLLLGFYLSLQVLQVILCQGFPLLWIFQRSAKTYMDYGIQSLNGLLNAIYLVGTTGFFLIYLKQKGKMRFVFLMFLMAIPIFLVTRQLMISLFLQISCCALIYNPRLIRTFLKIACVILILFMVVGNLRTGLDTLISILGPKDYIPTLFYPFLWIYAYIVTPFNNVNASIDTITPLGSLYHELMPLLPSFFRQSASLEGGYTGFELVHKNMTVSTFYIEPLLDFGRVWAFVFMAVFQFFLVRSYRKALYSRLPLHIMEYSVYYMITCLSIFSNLLLFLPVVAQLLVLNVIKIQLRKKKGHLFIAAGPNI